MKPEIQIVLLIFVTFALLELAFSKLFSKKGQTNDDAIVETLGGAMLLLVSQPFALFMGALVAASFVPQYEGVLSTWHWLPVLGLFLVFDDMMQY